MAPATWIVSRNRLPNSAGALSVDQTQLTANLLSNLDSTKPSEADMDDKELKKLRDAYNMHRENAEALRRMGCPSVAAQKKADELYAKLIAAKRGNQ
jgi:hypothetical protein